MLTISFEPAEREVLLHRLRSPDAISEALADRFAEGAVRDAVTRLETQIKHGFAIVNTAVEGAVLRDAIERSAYRALPVEAAVAGKITPWKLAAIKRNTRIVVAKVTDALNRAAQQATEEEVRRNHAPPPSKPQITFLGDTFGDRLLREWVSSNFTSPLEAEVIIDHVPDCWVKAQSRLPDGRHLQTVHGAADDDTGRKIIVMCEAPSVPGGYHSWAYLHHKACADLAHHRRGTQLWNKAEAKRRQAEANMIGWASR